MSTSEPTPELAQLCSICHLALPKYRCPRCSIRTCSLTCTKRHKQWAQCSGVRDPGAYLRRHVLATPKAFDQDYNFISGLERLLERSERDAENRGIDLTTPDASNSGYRNGPWRDRNPGRGEVQLRRAMEECGVVVVKAPKGMSRNASNRTGWNKKQGCIVWTVEWIYEGPSGMRKELGTVYDNVEIQTAFETHLAQQKAKVAGDHDQLTKRPRKRRRKNSTGHGREEGQDPEADKSKEQGDAGEDESTVEAALEIPASTRTQEPAQPITADQQQPAQAENHFYIHQTRPTTARTKKTALLHLEPTHTLSQGLCGAVVKEFPTVYVLAVEPQKVGDRAEYALESRPAFFSARTDPGPGPSPVSGANMQQMDESRVRAAGGDVANPDSRLHLAAS